MSDQDEKTEKPTPKKLKESKDEGKVARSKDLNLAASSLSATAVLVWLGPTLVHRLADAVSASLNGVGSRARADVTPGDLTSLVIANGALIGLLVGPIAIAAAIA